MKWARLALCLLTLAIGQAQAREHVVFDFRKRIEDLPQLQLYGPDMDRVARTDDEGLRIDLPAGAKQHKVGVELLHRIRGDFDIALGYELLQVSDPPPEVGAGVAVWIDFAAPLSASLTRLRKPPRKDLFGANRITPGPDGKSKIGNIPVPAQESRGKLRLVRTGPQVVYWVKDGEADYRRVRAEEMGTEEVKSLRVYCTTGARNVAVSVRLLDLVIDADEFPGGPVQSQVSDQPILPILGWITAALVVLLASLSLIWFLMQRRRTPAKAIPISTAESS
jgi:hypothetical protein